MTEETFEEKKARWNRAKEVQRVWLNSPQYKQLRAKRIETGLCVLENGWCITHGVPDTTGHFFDNNPDITKD